MKLIIFEIVILLNTINTVFNFNLIHGLVVTEHLMYYFKYNPYGID